MPQRERYLFVCTNRRPEGNPKGSCAQGGSEAIREALKSECDSRGLRHVVRVCTSGCLDLCWAGPSIAVMPDNVFYGHVTLDDVPEIIESFAARTLVERLVLPPEEFDAPEKRARKAAQEGSS